MWDVQESRRPFRVDDYMARPAAKFPPATPASSSTLPLENVPQPLPLEPSPRGLREIGDFDSLGGGEDENIIFYDPGQRQ